MVEQQSKNTIKAILTVTLGVFIGEGILGIGLFWPFLLVLLERKWIYWLALAVGIFISVIYRMSVGLPSLFLVAVVGGLSFLVSSRKESGWVILIFSLMANFVFDKVFDLDWGVFDFISVIFAWIAAIAWFEKGETIKIRY